MPFKANNTPLPRAFSKNQAASGKARATDELVEVTGYDLPRAVMFAKRISNGRELEIRINPEKAASARDAAAAREAADAAAGKAHQPSSTLNGALIDSDMQKKMPVGSWAALESAVFQRRSKVGNVERLVLEANWINKSESNTPEKAIQGVFTVEAYQGNVQRVQSWHEHIDCMEDQAGLTALADRLNQEYRAYDPEVFVPHSGVQFIALLKTDETRTVYDHASGKRDKQVGVARCIDMSPRYDRRYDGSDQDKEWRPLDGASMIENLNGYIDYLEERFPEQANAGDITVEVVPYTTYRVLQKYIDSSFVLGQPRTWERPDGTVVHSRKRIDRMANTLMPQAIQMGDEEEPLYRGGNMAVRGILLLLGDKMENDPVSGTPRIIKQYACKRLLTNGYYGPVHTLGHAADGRVIAMDPRLVPANTDDQAPAQTQGQGRTASQTTGGQTGARMSDLAEDDDPFRPASASAYEEALGAGAPTAQASQEPPQPEVGSFRSRRR